MEVFGGIISNGNVSAVDAVGAAIESVVDDDFFEGGEGAVGVVYAEPGGWGLVFGVTESVEV